MHLTAVTEPTATRRVPTLPIRGDRRSLRYSCWASTGNVLVNRRTSIFPRHSALSSCVTDFLVWRRGKFHDFVIGGGLTYPEVGLSGCDRPSNDEVLIANSDTSASAARGGDE